jgi:hypothetical protein
MCVRCTIIVPGSRHTVAEAAGSRSLVEEERADPGAGNWRTAVAVAVCKIKDQKSAWSPKQEREHDAASDRQER